MQKPPSPHQTPEQASSKQKTPAPKVKKGSIKAKYGHRPPIATGITPPPAKQKPVKARHKPVASKHKPVNKSERNNTSQNNQAAAVPEGLPVYPTSRENQYQIALYLSDFDPSQVNGYQEFKPGGHRYDPNQAYNYYIQVATMMRNQGQKPAAAMVMSGVHLNVHHQYYLNPSTKAGQIMHAQKMKEGKDYEPSPALLQQQYIEQSSEKELLERTEKALYLALRCTLKIDQLLYHPQTPNSQKARLMSKRAKMQATQAKLLKAVFEHSGKGQEAAQMQQANVAIPISYIVEALTVVFAAGIALAILATITAHLFDLFTDIDDLVGDIDIGDLIDEIEGVTLPKNQTGPNPANPLPLPVKAQEMDCNLTPVGRHRGPNKNNTHDLADRIPPNVIQGTDWDLYQGGDRKAGYDALSPNNELWEVKAVFLSQMANDFYETVILPGEIQQIRIEHQWAIHCGYDYVLGCIDQAYATAINNELPQVNTRIIP